MLPECGLVGLVWLPPGNSGRSTLHFASHVRHGGAPPISEIDA